MSEWVALHPVEVGAMALGVIAVLIFAVYFAVGFLGGYREGLRLRKNPPGDPFHDVELLESRCQHWGISRRRDESDMDLRARLFKHVADKPLGVAPVE